MSVVAPERAVPGERTAVLVTLQASERAKPLNVTLRLVTRRSSEPAELLAQNTVSILGEKYIKAPYSMFEIGI